MIKDLKNERGITLLTLVITVIMLAILTVALSMNTYTSLNLARLTKLQNDVDLLDNRIATYYVKEGKLPIYKEENAHFAISKSTLAGQIDDLATTDGDTYYTIDLEALDISMQTLNYGAGYRSPDSTDRYIVNEETHIVYYLKGINYDGDVYHTVGKNI